MRTTKPIFRTWTAAIGVIGLLLAGSAAADETFIVSEPFEMDEPVQGMGGGPFVSPVIAGSHNGFLILSGGSGITFGIGLDADAVKLFDLSNLLVSLFEECSPSAFSFDPVVASNGETYLLAGETSYWEEGEYYFVYSLINSASGEPIGSLDVFAPCLGPGGGVESLSIAAMENGDYLAVWIKGLDSGGREVRGVRIDGVSGELLDPKEGILIGSSTYIGELKMAADGAGFLAAWSSYDDETEADVILASRILPNGSVSTPEAMKIVDNIGYLREFTATGTDNGFAVVWSDMQGGDGTETELLAASVSSDASQVSEATMIESVSTESIELTGLSAAASGAQAFIAWHEEEVGDWETGDVYGAEIQIGTGVSAAEPIILCDEPLQQESPAIAFGGDVYLAVWQDNRNGAWHIYGAIIDSAASEVLDPEGISIVTGVNDQYEPMVAASDQSFFVTWADSRFGPDTACDIMGVRVSFDGAPMDSQAVILHNGAGEDWNRGAVLFDGVVHSLWTKTEYQPYSETGTVGLTRVDPITGAVLSDNPEIVPRIEGVNVTPSLTVAENSLFLAYAAGTEIRAAFLQDVLSPIVLEEPIYTMPEPESPGDDQYISDLLTASDGSTVLAMWQENVTPYGTADYVACSLKAQRLDVSSQTSVSPVGNLLTLDDIGCARMVVVQLGEGFAVFWPKYDNETESYVSLMAKLIPSDPSAEIPAAQELQKSDYEINWVFGTRFGEGVFLALRNYVPIEGMNAYTPTMFGVLLDADLSVRIPPTYLQEGTWDFSIAARDDTILSVAGDYAIGSSRLVGRIIKVGEDDGTDDGEDDGTDGDTDGDGGIDAITPEDSVSEEGCGCSVSAFFRPGLSLIDLLL
jgi:hypothetical protein